MILVQDICAGMWNAGLVMTQCISIPFLIAGMAAGSVLVKRMSQEIFMKSHLHITFYIRNTAYG